MPSRGAIRLIVILIAVIGFAIGGYNYYMDSPVHVLNMVRGAVINHDRELFEKYVDTDDIIDDSCYVLAELLLDTDKTSRNYSAEYLNKMTRENTPLVKEILKKHLRLYIQGEKSQNQDKNLGPIEAAYPQYMEVAASEFMKRLNLDYLSFSGVRTSIIRGNSAVLDVDFIDSRLNQKFSLKVHLERLDNGRWKVRELVNLKEFLYDINKAVKDVLKEKNKPLKDEINQYAKIHDVSAEGISGTVSADSLMKIYVPICFSGKKEVRCVEVRVYLKEPTVHRYREVFNIEPQCVSGEMVYTIEKPLGFFVKDAEAISGLNPEKIKFAAVIRRIEFKDGTSIKLLSAKDL